MQSFISEIRYPNQSWLAIIKTTTSPDQPKSQDTIASIDDADNHTRSISGDASPLRDLNIRLATFSPTIWIECPSMARALVARPGRITIQPAGRHVAIQERWCKDSPQLLSDQATISAPYMHAGAVESLLPYLLPRSERRPRRILDIGSGSGFLVHMFAELAGETGVVVGVDHIENLRKLGETNMRKSTEGAALLASGRVRFRLGDGRKGWSEPSPANTVLQDEGDGWDAIHVGAAAVKLHDELVQQLRSPGRLFIPAAEEENNWFSDKYIWTVDKDEKGNVTQTKYYKVQYVSLMDAPREKPLV
ncbi:protein-L-isoaspartate O-methyltransferase [Zalerion maritima]|uniref:protein-L-isoaspartate(D-aspartate) O-methyltransferase n=1 Tax=Zalerion maritima TaxID=339359 RepID=A0AAD5RYY8_9PEZI|nr:protein-L-isoaspartate O-methyltransferase [Zalerion maritima]